MFRGLFIGFSHCVIMRFRFVILTLVLFNVGLIVVYVKKQENVAELLAVITEQSLNKIEQEQKEFVESLENITLLHRDIKQKADVQFRQLRHLLEESRKNYIRIKGIKEKDGEDLEEKIVEIASLLDVKMTTNDIERANRIGVRKSYNGRVVVAQLTNYKLKQTLIRRASLVAPNFEFSVKDDLTNYIAGLPELPEEHSKAMTDCSFIEFVGPPVTHGKSSVIFGAWLRDSSSLNNTENPFWVLSHFFENRVVEKYTAFRDVIRWRPQAIYNLPYEWAGTGHAVYRGSLYFNKRNSSVMVKFNFKTKSIEVERSLPDAAFGNTAPYQWSGTTDIDFAVDEIGLWVIYATLDNSMDIVISQLNPDNLEVLQSWNTNWRKQWSGNAFMACGVLYVLKKYDEKKTSLSYMYDTRKKSFKHIQIPFVNLYEWNTMLSYNHKEKILYAWDRGYLITYNVTFEK